MPGWKRGLGILLLAITLGAGLTGCALWDGLGDSALLNGLVEMKWSQKEHWEINPENAAQVIGKAGTYQILDRRIPREEIDSWTGMIGMFAVLDEENRVLRQEKMQPGNIAAIVDILRDAGEEAALSLTYQSVCTIQGEEGGVCVDINGNFYQAVPLDDPQAQQNPLQLEFTD